MPKSPKREKKAKVKDIWLQLLTRQRDMEIAMQKNADKELDLALAPPPEKEEETGGGEGKEGTADGLEQKDGEEGEGGAAKEGEGEGEPEEEKELTPEELAEQERLAAEKAKAEEADRRARELMALKPQEHVLVVCGAKAGGKSAFVQGFLNPSRDTANLKPTTALEYAFGRKARGTVKDVVHVWELGGGLKLRDMLMVPVTPHNLPHAALCITVDLSEPGTALQVVQKWIQLVREQYKALVKEYLASKDLDEKSVSRLEKKAKLRVLKAQNNDCIDPTVLPIIIVCTKMDVFHEQATNKRKALFNALRYHAHVNGASIIAVSRKDKTQGNFLRGILNHYAFGNPFKSSQVLDSAKAIVVPVGADSFEAIGLPGGCESIDDFLAMSPAKRAQAWTATVEEFFETTPLADEGGEDDEEDGEGGGKREDLSLAPEPVVDAMVRQKEDELEKYRKEAERKRRLAATDKKKSRKS